MYWLPIMYDTTVGVKFTAALNICSTNPLCDMIFEVFKMISNHVESFHRKTLFYTCFKNFFVVENSFIIVTKLNKINTKKKAKNILTFKFTTLYTTIPHKSQLKFYLKLQILSSNQKLEVTLAFEKY